MVPVPLNWLVCLRILFTNAALQLDCTDCKDCNELNLSLIIAIFEKCCVLIQSSDACISVSSQVNIVTCGGSLSDFEYMGLSE